jgi:hypothetical protein
MYCTVTSLAGGWDITNVSVLGWPFDRRAVEAAPEKQLPLSKKMASFQVQRLWIKEIRKRLQKFGFSHQQNFLLLGGHAQQAFIDMSQVALFSLPACLGFESFHYWSRHIWPWHSNASGRCDDYFGRIQHFRLKEQTSVQQANTQFLLFNTTSSSWIASYTNPSSPTSPTYAGESASSSPGPLKTSSEKAALGAGLAFGLLALAGILLIWFLYSRRLRQKCAIREKELRELDLGGKSNSYLTVTGVMTDFGAGPHPETRSASWGSRQESKIGTPSADTFPCAPVIYEAQTLQGEPGCRDDASARVEGKSLHLRGPTGYGTAIGNRTPNIGEGIHGIDNFPYRRLAFSGHMRQWVAGERVA